MYFSTVSCCGIREIGDLSSHKTPQQAVAAFVKQTLKAYRSNFRYAIFSEAVYEGYPGSRPRKPYGRAFAAYLKTEKLGRVAATAWNKNPNSGNNLKAWIWTVDWEALQAWEKKHKSLVGNAPAWVRTPLPVPPGPAPIAGANVVAAVNG